MEFRSTQSRYVHFQGDVVTNVSSGGVENSSHGVHLTGGSTGGIVTAAGDETNIGLTVRAKGSGPLSLGSTASAVAINSTTVTIGSASTTGISNIQRFRIQATVPVLSSAGTAGAIVQSTVTHASATTNAFYLVTQRVSYNSTSDPAIQVIAHSSAAAELTLTFFNHGPSSLSGSTTSFHLLQFSV